MCKPDHHIRLTKSLKEDLSVRNRFLSTYNGRTCCQDVEVGNHEVSLFMDASGSLAFGAIYGTAWCADTWPTAWILSGLCRNLTLLEFFPIVVAVELWGPHLRNKRVCFWSDNMGVVNCINSLTSSSLPVLSLLRHLVLKCLEFNIWFRSSHVPGVENSIADALSRFNFRCSTHCCQNRIRRERHAHPTSGGW